MEKKDVGDMDPGKLILECISRAGELQQRWVISVQAVAERSAQEGLADIRCGWGPSRCEA
jgi:hypothetical protein